MNASATWKVGALAEAGGLTVRTLHHWDAIGLLSPSRRTPGGHREYTEDDLARLYQVLALRSLGLGLETIATCLDGGVDPTRLVRDHLAGVEAALASLTSLRERLQRLDTELTAGRAPATADLLDALQATGATAAATPERTQVLRDRLDADQLRLLQDRAAAVGPAAHYLLEVEWPELYRRADRLRTAGVPPTDPKVRRLVARMDELSALFSGGDTATSTAVRGAWRDAPHAMSGERPGATEGWGDLADYLDLAREGAPE
ncbi:MerR family transcriptional regulator [Streptomyces roseoverticillatus]|uniref:MerR family transcriptional regulator n=1 Tax=Streptomyces roseoverticillatus TaxID=66429 RepID=UPI001F2794A7|nr:MerR family transcriptional regulator [Streptomyces roseoverticillatus]MCF3103907.1 MerR family transcriptional regulator [Streptomyces roseoverticillatus]